MPHPGHSREEIAVRGEELYQRQIRGAVEPHNRGRFLALDIDSGDYAMGDDELAALDSARRNHPDGTFYLLRVGYPTAAHLGSARPRSK